MNKTYWSDETPNEGEPQMLRVPIVDNEAQQFVSILHEASWLGYLTGRQARMVDDIPLREQAELFIEVLGLKELMEFNLSLDEEETDTEE